MNWFMRLFRRHRRIRGYDATHLQKGGVPRPEDWQEWSRWRWIFNRRWRSK